MVMKECPEREREGERGGQGEKDTERENTMNGFYGCEGVSGQHIQEALEVAQRSGGQVGSTPFLTLMSQVQYVGSFYDKIS